ncbi:vacuole effluxer Atg22 like-domain-containing protein [Infundibulicybe gibba]|nr:vacuole effluxer Atg22 like-domain-containing protein [Infundibulicybe gibba]
MQGATQYKRRLHGWLSYAFASEVFVIQFARDNGFLLPDKTTPCSPLRTTNATAVSARAGGDAAARASFRHQQLYVYSISVALQALTVISMGGIADHPPHRKLLLLSFALTGSVAAMIFLLLPSTSPVWFLSAPLAMLANIGFGASTVAMNAYLPSLARSSPEVERIRTQIQDAAHPEADADPSEDPHAPLIHSPTSPTAQHPLQKEYDAELSRATSRISSLGIALGYGAGILLLIVALIPVTKLGGSTFALRLAIGLSGIWWAPGDDAWGAEVPDLPWNTRREIVAAWKRLGIMLRWKEIKRLRNTFTYLAAWFLLSDGFTTITSTAILFGKTTLNMPPSSLILVGVLTPTSGILGSLVWPVLQRKLGSVYGAFQGYARALYAELLPPGEEARWYGLFSITDKSSSFLGPLIVGVIADTTGNIRYAFFFLVFMIWLAVPVLTRVDIEKGRRDAQQYAASSH